MAITAGWAHRGGSGTTLGCQCPCSLVIDAGSVTTSTHTYTAAGGGVGIRFDENQWTGVTYTKATKRLSKTGLASLLSWEKVSLGTLPGGTSGAWTASIADAGALWHDGTSVHSQPVAIQLNGTVIAQGTLGALSNEQWAWGDADSIGNSRIYVQSALSTPTVHIIYGDGTHLRFSSALGSIALNWYEVADKINEDTIELVSDPYAGAEVTLSDIVIYQNVNPWFDLEYKWSVSPITGVESIANGDQRPGAGSTTIDSSKGYGPMWAFVPKAGCSSITITCTINDHTNGDTEATKALVFTETAWSSTDYYIDFTLGDDTTGDGSIGLPWKTWTKLLNSLRTVSGPRRGFLKKGETFTETVAHTQWNNETDETYIGPYGSGTMPKVTCGNTITLFDITENAGTKSANIRIDSIHIEKTTGAQVMMFWNGNNNLLLNCNLTYGGSINANGGISRGSSATGVDDSVVWGCNYETTNASANYWFYDSGASTSGLRMAYVGNYVFGIGGGSTSSNFRTFCKQRLFLYNRIVRTNATQNPLIRLYGGPGTNKQNYVAYNYLVGTTGTVNGIVIADDGTGNNADTLFEGNYIDLTGSTGTTSDYQFEDAAGPNIVLRNNVSLGRHKFINLTQSVGMVRVFNNSYYSGVATQAFFFESTASFSCFNLKIFNNAARANSSITTCYVVRNTGSFGTIESTQMKQNMWDWGAVSSGWSVEGSSGGWTGAGWPAQTNKATQLNYSGNQGKDNDPLFTNAPAGNFLPTGVSPCIGTAYVLSSIKRDYRGYVPETGTRNDIGAIQVNGINPDTGSGGGSTPGMGSLAARFRCVGNRRH